MWNKLIYHTKGIYYSHRSEKIAQLTIKSMSNLLTPSSSLAAAGCADLKQFRSQVNQGRREGFLTIM
jgi:hypothetical protein